MDITKQMIMEQLLESTGRAMCDSGDAYGRHWQRNAGKTWEELSEPPVVLEAYVYTHGDKPELELTGTVKLAAYMENSLTYSSELQAAYEAWVEANDPEGDEFDMQHMEGFAASAHSGGKHDITGIIYTYNEDNSLSQDIQYIQFKWMDADEFEQDVVLVQVHQGCDARGGMGSPKAYVVRDDVYFGDCRINGYGCNSQSWDEEMVNQSYPEKGVNLDDLPVYDFKYISNLKADLEALKLTDKNTPEVVEAMTQQDKLNAEEAFHEFCEALEDVSVVVYNHKAYYVDAEPEEIYGDSYSLMG